MQIDIEEINGVHIASISSPDIEIKDPQDALDILGNCSYQGAEAIVINQQNITPAFFDLKTGIAGEVLQKFSNYRMRLAITGDFTSVSGKSLRDFIFESNKHGHILFVPDVETAKQKLSGK